MSRGFIGKGSTFSLAPFSPHGLLPCFPRVVHDLDHNFEIRRIHAAPENDSRVS